MQFVYLKLVQKYENLEKGQRIWKCFQYVLCHADFTHKPHLTSFAEPLTSLGSAEVFLVIANANCAAGGRKFMLLGTL